MVGASGPIDPDDGLPTLPIGPWAEREKHQRVRRYVDISRGVRRKYLGSGRSGATYIDLFAGPGRCTIREENRIVDGSPLVAFREALRTGTPFSTVYIADTEESCAQAVSQRLARLGANVRTRTEDAEIAVDNICKNLDVHSLHFAFLDPFSLGALPFSIIEKLAAFQRMDLLIHVSSMDLQRNLSTYMEADPSPLDRFCPGWRNRVDPRRSQAQVRARLLAHFTSLIRDLGMTVAEGIESVRGRRNQPLYWLVFAARHERALEFWAKIRNVSGQGDLFSPF